MNIVTGKKDSGPSLFEKIGFSHFYKFGAEDIDEYVKNLNKMNLSDLQAHAMKLGVMPKHDRNRIIRTLKQEFTKAKTERDVSRLPHAGKRSPETQAKLEELYSKI